MPHVYVVVCTRVSAAARICEMVGVATNMVGMHSFRSSRLGVKQRKRRNHEKEKGNKSGQ